MRVRNPKKFIFHKSTNNPILIFIPRPIIYMVRENLPKMYTSFFRYIQYNELINLDAFSKFTQNSLSYYFSHTIREKRQTIKDHIYWNHTTPTIDEKIIDRSDEIEIIPNRANYEATLLDKQPHDRRMEARYNRFDNFIKVGRYTIYDRQR